MKRILNVISTWHRRGFILALFVFVSPPLFAASVDNRLDWRTLETDHFLIHYDKNEKSLAEKTAAMAELIHDEITTLLQWTPTAKTHVTLIGQIDMSNGAATALPYNQIWLYSTPPNEVAGLEDFDDWLYLLLKHEYVHVIHLDKVGATGQGIRNALGRVPLIFVFTPFPNWFTPRWLKEGLATWVETDYENGFGRGQSSYYRALMRMEVQRGMKSLREVNLQPYDWPLGTAWYLYGVYFHDFVIRKYGLERYQTFTNIYSNHLFPYLMNPVMNKTLSKDFYDLWDEFVAEMNQEFGAELQRIENEGIVAGDRLSHSAYDSGNAVMDEHGGIYYIMADLERTARLMYRAADSDVDRYVSEVYGSNIDYHPEHGILISQFDIEHNINIYADLYRIDPDNGEQTRLTEDRRYVLGKWNRKGDRIYAVHVNNGQHELHILDLSGKLIEANKLGENTYINTLDISSGDRMLVASVFREDASWNIESFDLETRQWRFITKSPELENSVRFVPGVDNEILFSADYDGVFNIYRYHLETKSLIKLTHVLGGALVPTISNDASTLYYKGINTSGTDLYALKLENPATNASVRVFDTNYRVPKRFIQPAQVAHIDYDYSPGRYLEPVSWLPFFNSTDSYSELGLITNGGDPLQYHSYRAQFSYDFDNNLLAGAVDYNYTRFMPEFNIQYERLHRYLEDGPLNLITDWDIASVTVLLPWLRVDKRLQWLIGATYNTEIISRVNSHNADIFVGDELNIGTGILFQTTRQPPRSLTPNEGISWIAVADFSDETLSSYPGGTAGQQDFNFYTPPYWHTITHGRLAFGAGESGIRPFELEGNQSPAHEIIGVGKRRYTLRGYPAGVSELSGNRFALASLDLSFPLATPQFSFMLPPVGVTRLWGNVFMDAGAAWSSNETIPSASKAIGAELTIDSYLGYLLPLDIKIGYAEGLDKYGEGQGYISTRAVF